MNKLKGYLLVLVIMFFCMSNVHAFSGSTGVITQNGTSVVTDSSSGYGLAVKVADNKAYICTAYHIDTPAGHNISCTLNDDWDLKTRMGVAAIINAASNKFSITEVTNEYFAAELAINQFLYEKDGGKEANNLPGINNLGSSYKTLYNTYLTTARTAYDKDISFSFSIDTTDLTFTRLGDNYVSNTVTVTSNTGYDVSTNVGSIEKNGNSFKVIVPVSSTSMGNTTNVNVTITSGKVSYNVARNYTCGSYQTLTPPVTESVEISDKKYANGSITRELSKIKVNKVDAKNKKIKDVQFMLQTESQYKNNVNGVVKVTDGTNDLVFDNLTAGKYYLKEIKPADGYNEYTQIITVTIDDDGQAYVNVKKLDNNTIKVTNTKTETKISKINAVDGKELPGATLEILNEKKEKMSCTILDKDGKEKVLDECSWVSGDTPVTIIGLNKGKYYLKETIAPEGFVLNQEMVEFEVTANGTTGKVEMKNELIVEVPNTLSTKSAMLVAIAMFDIALGIGILVYVKRNRIEE